MKPILGLLVLISLTFRAESDQMVTSNVNNDLQTSNSTQVPTDQDSYNETYNPLTTDSDSYTTETVATAAPTDGSNLFPTDNFLPTDSTTLETILESETTLPTSIFSVVQAVTQVSPNRYSTDETSINSDSPIPTDNSNQMETVTVSDSPPPAATTVKERYSSKLQTESGSDSLTETSKVDYNTITSDSASEDQSNENSNSMESVQYDTICVVYDILREARMAGYRGLKAADWICIIKNNMYKPSGNNIKARCRNSKSQKAKYPCECFGNNVRKYIQCYMQTVRGPAGLW
ncbi:hypothetical protein XELAEV_18040180mg [Xenopus laevis]|nr:hypothetical protein XELAEV_18040180mg [Xenopus laevis]